MNKVMMTHKATAQETENKLRRALEELKASKELCQQLLQEREDSKIELKQIIDKNSLLKKEMAELHIDLMDTVAQRDELQDILTSLKHCSETHEQTLSHINKLENELNNSQKVITDLEFQVSHQKSTETQSLFDELMESSSSSRISGEKSIIKRHVTSGTVEPMIDSHNKLKKYKRINKVIKKCNKAIRFKKTIKTISALAKEKMLREKLEKLNLKLLESNDVYGSDIQCLQTELKIKEDYIHS